MSHVAVGQSGRGGCGWPPSQPSRQHPWAPPRGPGQTRSSHAKRWALRRPAATPHFLLHAPRRPPQGTYLRLVASDSALWEGHALARWPGARPELHGGSWARLWRARAAMPAPFPAAADRIHSLTAAAAQRASGDGAQQGRGAAQREALDRLAFEELMQQVYEAGRAAAGCALQGGARGGRPAAACSPV